MLIVSLLKLLTDEELNSIMTIDLIQTFVINIINLMKQKGDIRIFGIKLGKLFITKNIKIFMIIILLIDISLQILPPFFFSLFFSFLIMLICS